VTWLRDNQSIEYDQQRVQLLEDGSLHISDVVLDDVGVYQCMASNINGSDSSYVGELNVTGECQHNCICNAAREININIAENYDLRS